MPCHTGLVLLSDRGSGLGRVGADKQVRLVRGDRDAFGLHGRSAEQRIALDLLLDPDVGIVSASAAGPARARARWPCAPASRRSWSGASTARSSSSGRCTPWAARSSGYLPGSEAEKMGPWAQAVFDTLGALVTHEVVEEVMDRGMLEVLPLTHIRGRSLHDAFVIVDEAQSLERNVLLTVLSPDRPELQGGADPRRRPAGQPPGRPPRRRGRGHRGAQGPPALRPRHPHPQRARPIAALVTDLLEGLEVSADAAATRPDGGAAPGSPGAAAVSGM